MNIYHIWCNIEEDVQDYEFAEYVMRYCDHLKAKGHLHRYRITRRKLGLGPSHLPEFHIMLEFENMASYAILNNFIWETVQGYKQGTANVIEGFRWLCDRDMLWFMMNIKFMVHT